LTPHPKIESVTPSLVGTPAMDQSMMEHYMEYSTEALTGLLKRYELIFEKTFLAETADPNPNPKAWAHYVNVINAINFALLRKRIETSKKVTRAC